MRKHYNLQLLETVWDKFFAFVQKDHFRCGLLGDENKDGK